MEKKRVLVSDCVESFWFTALDNLQADYKWELVYWLQSKRYNDFPTLEKKYPGVVFHDNYDAVKGLPAPAFKGKAFPYPDADLIEDFRDVEAETIKMMDRMDPMGIFRNQDRVKLYYEYLAYWDYMLDEIKPDVYLTSVTPHLCYDFVLMKLCKRKGIKTVQFINTPMQGRVIITSDYDDVFVPIDYSIDRDVSKLTDQSEAYLKKVTSSYDKAIPNYMVRQFNEKSVNSAKVDVARRTVRYLRKMRNKHVGQAGDNDVIATYMKLPNRRIHDEVTKKEMQWYDDEIRKKTLALEEAYQRVAKPSFDQSKPFIYVAMMFQPERTSCPDGGKFVNQYLMVNWLSEMAGDDYQIIIKEHPSQFMFNTQQARELWFYDELDKLPNVTFVSTDYNSFELIDKSSAVATVNGTVGFEAYCRLKPAIIFGYSWYRGARGVYAIKDKSDLKNAFSKISVPVTMADIRRFYLEFDERISNAYVEDWAKPEGFSAEENAQNLTKIIGEFVETNQ